MHYTVTTQALEYKPALEYFRQFPEDLRGFLLESADTAPIYGRMSLFSVDPPIEIIGKDETFSVMALNDYGKTILSYIASLDLSFAQNLQITATTITGTVPRTMELLDESARQQQPNVSNIIRVILNAMNDRDPYLGLYGAFSYDFVRLFEDLPNIHSGTDIPDFHLYLPDIIYVVDHIKETAELRYYNFSDIDSTQRLTGIQRAQPNTDFAVGELTADMDRVQYEAKVDEAKTYMKQGDIFEIVLSRKFSADFSGSTLGLYERYRTVNPSPYMFYFRFEYQDALRRTLLGASPEMFVRVENNVVTTRPISGTARRSDDPITDYENMMQLLNSAKEKSELDMLVDLARNDVSRVCVPGLTLQDYRYVEKYSKVMHTIAHVEGVLDTERYTAFDAFIACLNAGTLTGAPKVRAMELIEELETKRRGYYGGSVGYVTFNNELNTGIIIRSATIDQPMEATQTGTISTQAGASLIYDSHPTAEYEETQNKSLALREVLQ